MGQLLSRQGILRKHLHSRSAPAPFMYCLHNFRAAQIQRHTLYRQGRVAQSFGLQHKRTTIAVGDFDLPILLSTVEDGSQLLPRLGVRINLPTYTSRV